MKTPKTFKGYDQQGNPPRLEGTVKKHDQQIPTPPIYDLLKPIPFVYKPFDLLKPIHSLLLLIISFGRNSKRKDWGNLAYDCFVGLTFFFSIGKQKSLTAPRKKATKGHRTYTTTWNPYLYIS